MMKHVLQTPNYWMGVLTVAFFMLIFSFASFSLLTVFTQIVLFILVLDRYIQSEKG